MRKGLFWTIPLLLLAGCNREQSAFAPFGAEAREILTIAIALGIGATILCLIVIAVYIRAVRAPEGQLGHKGGMRMVLWLGAIGPTIILTILLLFALPAMRPRAAGPSDLVIHVDGQQFWWRVAYAMPGGPTPLVSANEVRLPVGRTVTVRLTASDVIHSFWIPGLAGKMDMIPGRTNQLVVRAEKTGRFRGVCAEFCGLSHALMALDVIVMEPAAFDRWLADSRAPVAPAAMAGRALFDAQGCGGCHAIRGTPHEARIGPDLSRFGERAKLGAGILPPTRDRVAAFIRAPQQAKPGVRMPAFPHLSEAEALAIADYLKELK